MKITKVFGGQIFAFDSFRKMVTIFQMSIMSIKHKHSIKQTKSIFLKASKYLEFILKSPGKNLERIRESPSRHPEIIRKQSGNHQRRILERSWKVLGKSPESPRKVPGKSPESLRKVPGIQCPLDSIRKPKRTHMKCLHEWLSEEMRPLEARHDAPLLLGGRNKTRSFITNE